MNSNNISITCPTTGSLYNKVACIKAIRTITGLGLKEAKDATELPGIVQVFPVMHGISEQELENQYRILRSDRFEVGHSVHIILNDLRELATKAIQQGEDELANEILQLVLAEKLRRKPGVF